MKLQLYVFLILLIFLPACKKDRDASPVKKEAGYLLSSIIIDADTSRFEYNDKNQLIKWTSGSFAICDSFAYGPTGHLLSCRYRYRHNASFDVVSIACTYNNDTIIRTETNAAYSRYSGAKKYTLSNGQIVKAETGGVYDGVTTFYGSSYISYVYQDSNIIKCIRPFVTRTYQPVDTISYNTQFYNPYSTLGKHVWALIRDFASFPDDIVMGESKNLPSVESYATYSVTDTTLNFSGVRTYKTTLIEGAEENGFLPKVIRRVHDGGTEMVVKFAYIKEK